jgi:hypothetical protein
MRRTQVSKHKKDGHSLMYTPAGTGALGTSRLSIISLIISKAKKKATMKNKFNFFLTFFLQTFRCLGYPADTFILDLFKKRS